jgi:hypothetical protein
VNVHATFVSESTFSYERLATPQLQISRFVNIPRQLGKMCEGMTAKYSIVFLFELQVGHHRDQISVSTSLSDSIDGSLYLITPCINRG